MESIISTTKPLSYQVLEIDEKSSSCSAEPCTTVTISYPQFDGSDNSTNGWNKMIRNELITILSEDYVMEAQGDESLDQLVQLFLKSYDEFKESFPESNTPWTLDIAITMTYSSEDLLSLKVSTNSYTGGAHPNAFINYLNVLKERDVNANLSDIVTNETLLTETVEKEFRNMNNLQPNESLSEKGYTFENDRFSLPETFGFSDKGLIFYYNSYEISPYSEGPMEIIIPFKDLDGILKI